MHKLFQAKPSSNGTTDAVAAWGMLKVVGCIIIRKFSKHVKMDKQTYLRKITITVRQISI
jgi:hypothetical protein